MDVVYAKTTTHVSINGYQVLVTFGTHWPADDVVVQAYPDVFSTDPAVGLSFSPKPFTQPDATPVVEAATANPGEGRNVTPKTTAVKK